MILKEISQSQASIPDRIVIIGGGTLGLYAAHELVRRGKDVLVIEAGSEVLGNFAPETYDSVGKTHEGIRIGRSKSLGGTSNLWGGQLVEFQPVDFMGRDWLPDSKWPVTYEEVAAYHRKTYENLGIGPEFQDDAAILKQAGVPNPGFGKGMELFLTRWLKIPSMAVAYAEEIRSSKKLNVLVDHSVTGFEFEGGTISGVRIVGPKGVQQLVLGSSFILACGTFEISRLLLHVASSDGKRCPWRNNRNIGRYFQDHLIGRVASIEVRDKKRFFNTFSTIVRSGQKFQPKLRLEDATLRSERILNLYGMMSFESSVSENLVYLKQFLKAAIFSRKIDGISDLFRNLLACWKHLLPLMWKYVVANRVFIPSTSKVSLHIQSEQPAMLESRISIDTVVKDYLGLPKVILDWRTGSEELSSIRDFTRRVDLAFRESGMAELRVAVALEQGDPTFIDTLRDNYHQVGGARMGFSEEDGVVDRDLKVFGTDNLHVVGASTFRTSGNANTTFTALTFVTRLVDHLAQYNGYRS
jgi:choline dehydrogenase-like flavoprotein